MLPSWLEQDAKPPSLDEKLIAETLCHVSPQSSDSHGSKGWPWSAPRTTILPWTKNAASRPGRVHGVERHTILHVLPLSGDNHTSLIVSG